MQTAGVDAPECLVPEATLSTISLALLRRVCELVSSAEFFPDFASQNWAWLGHVRVFAFYRGADMDPQPAQGN